MASSRARVTCCCDAPRDVRYVGVAQAETAPRDPNPRATARLRSPRHATPRHATPRYATPPPAQFGDDASQEISKYFSAGHFPEEALSRTELFKEEVFAPLLRTDEGDPSVATFLPRDEFKVRRCACKQPCCSVGGG